MFVNRQSSHISCSMVGWICPS